MNMEKLIETLVAQSPVSGVLILFVWMGINYLKHRDAESREHDAEFLRAVQGMHAEHLDARKETREAIRDNSAAIRENSQVTAKLSEHVNHLAGG